jgi:hypothetical protein
MENVGTFNGHLEYITAIGHILEPFCKLVVSRYIFPRFGTLYQEKSGNPVHNHFFPKLFQPAALGSYFNI